MKKFSNFFDFELSREKQKNILGAGHVVSISSTCTVEECPGTGTVTCDGGCSASNGCAQCSGSSEKKCCVA